ncbi:MAG TPA: S9 family peptidase [Caulobacteraceae bacterium]|jgi:dipeptidyl aminopeptidase/acylaminoacyl peptidase
MPITARRIRKTFGYLVIPLAVMAATSARAQAAVSARLPAMTIQQAMSVDSLAAARISPNGRQAVYAVERPDWEANRFVSELWVASAETGQRYRLTSSNKSDFAARWSPDGVWVSFLSDRSGENQVYLIRAGGGEAVQLTKVAGGVSAYRWSPSGDRIAFIASDPEPASAAARSERSGGFEVLDSESSASADFARSHLWVIDVAGVAQRSQLSSPRRLTEGADFTINEFSWSPDGGRIAFSAVSDPTPKARASADLYVLDIRTGKVTKLVNTPGPDTYPVWSPDGRQIAYETANGSLTYFETNRYVALVPSAGGKPRLLTDNVDEQANLLVWGSDGLYVAFQEKTDLRLYRLDPNSKSLSLVRGLEKTAQQQWSFADDYRTMAFVGRTATAPPELYVTDLRNVRPKRLTSFSDQFKGFQIFSREVVQWRSSDGASIEGVLVKAAGLDAAKRHPLLVVVHGGPADVSRPLLSYPYAYPVDQFAAAGAIVLMPNYRGSIGYGEKFRAPNPRTLSDYEDVLAGVRSMIDRGLADPTRVGVMGWSQGGYLAALLATKGSQSFQAASVGASVPNWLTYYNSGDAGYWAAQWFGANPSEDPEVYRTKSPINYVANTHTPILIQHGQNDQRAPIAGAYEFYHTLQDHHVPVRMIIYQGAGHGVGHPKGQRTLMEHNYAWFSRWILAQD